MIGAGTTGVASINAKIEENETLANMKKQAAEGANQAATYMSSIFGWNATATEANANQPVEEVKGSGSNEDDAEIVEETKTQTE